MKENKPQSNFPDEISKLPKQMTRREFLSYLPTIIRVGSSAFLTYLAAYYGIKILEDSEKLPSIPINENQESLNSEEIEELPNIRKNTAKVLSEVNTRPSGMEPIKLKYDRVTNIISNLNPLLKEDINSTEHKEDKNGIKYASDIINSILQADFIPGYIDQIPEFISILESNPSLFIKINTFAEFANSFENSLNNYANIIIKDGKVQIVFGLKSTQYKGILPVSTDSNEESIIKIVDRKTFESLNNNTLIFRIRI
jgi:hypothetical protein